MHSVAHISPSQCRKPRVGYGNGMNTIEERSENDLFSRHITARSDFLAWKPENTVSHVSQMQLLVPSVKPRQC